jgi:hypothetical protein
VQQVMSFMGQVELILCTYPLYPVLNITSTQSSLNLYTCDVDHQWGAHTKQCLYYYTFGCVASFTWLTWLLQIYFDSLFELCFVVPWCWGMRVRINISWVLMSLLNQNFHPLNKHCLSSFSSSHFWEQKALHIIVDWGSSIADFVGPLITCLLLILEELWNGQFLFGAISQLSTEIDDVCGGNHLKGFWFKLLVDNPTIGLDNKQQWSTFPDVSLP